MKWHKVVVFVCMAMSILLLCAGCKKSSTYTTTDIADYGVFEGHIDMEQEDIQSGLFIFPAADTAGMTLETYFYHCESFAFDNSYQICLTATFEPSAYVAEIARLSGVHAEYNGVTHRILKADEGFTYPAYVSIFGKNDAEYALLDEERSRVIYIYRRFDTSSEKEANMPQAYLPQEYVVPDEYYDNNLEGYFMYCFEEPEELRVDGNLAWEVVKEH